MMPIPCSSALQALGKSRPNIALASCLAPRAVREFNELIVADGFSHLAVSYQHALKAGGFNIEHRDPFDRMLAAQSIIEGATLVTDDATMKLFRVKCFW